MGTEELRSGPFLNSGARKPDSPTKQVAEHRGTGFSLFDLRFQHLEERLPPPQLHAHTH